MVNDFRCSDHKTVQAQIVPMEAEKDLNSTTVDIIVQNCFVREEGIGT